MSDPDIAAMGTPPPRLPNLRRARPDPPPTPPAPAPVAEPPAPWKYSALLDESDREVALRVEAVVVRLAGIRPTKGMRADILRALFKRADTDEELQQWLAAWLRGGAPD